MTQIPSLSDSFFTKTMKVTQDYLVHHPPLMQSPGKDPWSNTLPCKGLLGLLPGVISPTILLASGPPRSDRFPTTTMNTSFTPRFQLSVSLLISLGQIKTSPASETYRPHSSAPAFSFIPGLIRSPYYSVPQPLPNKAHPQE